MRGKELNDSNVDNLLVSIKRNLAVYDSSASTDLIDYAASAAVKRYGDINIPDGRLLIEQEILTRENVSMQSIRAYLEKHPEKMKEIFIYNPSYVFFRIVEEGPMGAINVPLTVRFLFAVNLGMLGLLILGDPLLEKEWESEELIQQLADFVLTGIGAQEVEKGAMG